MTRLLAIALVGSAIGAGARGEPAPAEQPAGNVTFQILSAADNGTQAILEKRRAEVLERKGGKLGSHDWWLHGVTAFDFDNDGDLDLLVTIHGGRNGVLLKNLLRESGQVRFADVTREVGLDFLVPSADKKPWIWDFDGDGWLDIAGFSDETKNASFFNQKGQRFTQASFTFNPTSFPSGVVDLNGDGHPDLADHVRGREWLYDPAARLFRLRSVELPVLSRLPADVQRLLEDLKADPRNRFLRPSFRTDQDLNGDGRADVVLAAYGSYGGLAIGRYLMADQDGTLTDQTEPSGLPRTGTPVLVTDLTGDGAPEVLVAADPAGGLFLNDGRGKFALRPGPLTDFLRKRESYLHKAVPADFDADGDLDLVVSSPRLGQEVIYENLGAGNFRLLHQARGWDSEPIALADLDDDGLLDVAIGGPGNGVTLYLNRTAQPGHSCRIYPRMAAPNPYAVGARIEVFRAGELVRPGSRPFQIEDAHPDATPLFIGLGKADTFDLRVKFPGGKVVEHQGVAARGKLQVTPDGIRSDK